GVWPDGTIHWLYGRGEVLRDSNWKPVRMIGVNMDITERKCAEQALLESEERTRLAMQAGRMFAFEWDPQTDEVRRSYDCADITGSTAEATREAGKESLNRVHPEDQERLRQTIRSLTPANDTYQIEYRLRSEERRVGNG